jgi:group I intron endonuclease
MIIYKITNIISGKSYIGQTISSLNVRWSKHTKEYSRCYALSNAISKYGKENFEIEVIEKCVSRDELDDREVFWINYFNTKYPNGYNLKDGGKSPRHSETTKAKLSEIGLREDNPHRGIPRTSEVKEAIGSKAKARGTSGTEAAVASKRKSIICVETGEVFRSISDASRNFNNIGTSNICKVLKGKLDKISGFSFRYLENK